MPLRISEPRGVSGRPDAGAHLVADTASVTSTQLIHIADEWEKALSVAEDALKAPAFLAKDVRATHSALARERFDVVQSLVALARVLHLRANLASLAKPGPRRTASSY